ncbi:hypothetical protein [Sphaerisporangium corydalis]|uniref:Uncharacterized protein n=1 Tax=Sphaerisporangium corydalis TaxID=1441875 RepID=A0ABV9EVV2_9ACTN|nr:hypothetical protein [Sphaerisporangium corydalis]
MDSPDDPVHSKKHVFDWRRPPKWFSLLLIPIYGMVAVDLARERGPVVGIAAGVLYGLLIVVGLTLKWWTSWAQVHPRLDSLVIVPLIFVALAYLTSLSLLTCGIITAAISVPVLAVSVLTRRPRTGAAEELPGG